MISKKAACLLCCLLLVFSLLKSIPYLSSKNELSRKEEKMIFCMDYAGIGETEQKYRLIENTLITGLQVNS